MIHAMCNRMLAINQGAVTIKYHKPERIIRHQKSSSSVYIGPEIIPNFAKDRVSSRCNADAFFAMRQAMETTGEFHPAFEHPKVGIR
jgi:hypothetical protein